MAECPRPTDWLAGYEYLCDQLRLTQEWVASTFVYAEHSGMELTAPSLGPSWGAGWTPITEYDTAFSWNSDGIAVDTATGQFSFVHTGIYQINFSFAVEHDENNAGRRVSARVYNVATGTGDPTPTEIFIGRNQPGTNFATSGQIQVTDVLVGDSFRFEIGNGDAVAAINWISLDLSISGIAPLAGATPI